MNWKMRFQIVLMTRYYYKHAESLVATTGLEEVLKKSWNTKGRSRITYTLYKRSKLSYKILKNEKKLIFISKSSVNMVVYQKGTPASRMGNTWDKG